jgi:hypothetical protein
MAMAARSALVLLLFSSLVVTHTLPAGATHVQCVRRRKRQSRRDAARHGHP